VSIIGFNRRRFAIELCEDFCHQVKEIVKRLLFKVLLTKLGNFVFTKSFEERHLLYRHRKFITNPSSHLLSYFCEIPLEPRKVLSKILWKYIQCHNFISSQSTWGIMEEQYWVPCR
jgi:hypothetical protein